MIDAYDIKHDCIIKHDSVVLVYRSLIDFNILNTIVPLLPFFIY